VVPINPAKDEDIYLWLEQQKHGTVTKTIKALIRAAISEAAGGEEHRPRPVPTELKQGNRGREKRAHEPAKPEGHEVAVAVDEIVRDTPKPSRHDDQAAPQPPRQDDLPEPPSRPEPPHESQAAPDENEQSINPAVLAGLAALQNSFS
jgi:hypothetical protein